MALKVEVVCAFPRRATVLAVDLPEGATVGDALVAAGFREERRAGIFGEAVSLDRRLADGDRVEVYRPLERDPKEARRRRALKPRRR